MLQVPDKKPETPEIKLTTNLFNAVAELYKKKENNTCQDRVWSYDFGDWKIAINGFAVHKNFSPIKCTPTRIPPYSIVFWFKGVYRGWCNCFNVILVEDYDSGDGHALFNVDHLVGLIEEEIKKA